MNIEPGRQLAAIFFADIEGFTALMQKNHQEGIALRYDFLQILEQLHREHQGEIVRTMGDGSLSIFSNAVDAVNCAIAMQQTLLGKVPLRIGIHIGHVMRDPHDGIIGDAVNIASRIESFSVPGAVLLSDSVYEQVQNQQELSFKHLGNFHLKNTLRTYEIYAADAVGVEVPDASQLKGKGERTSMNAAPLPLPDMPLMGREEEIAKIRDRLLDDDIRLVTISGAGGMGKTRLSIAVAHELEHIFQEGIAYIGLTAVTDPKEVIPAINNALEIFEMDAVDPLNGLATVIGQGKVLLVLDNMEQVVNAASEVGQLLEKCSQLKILITSRIPLRITAEYEFKIGPLELPQKEIAGSHEDLVHNPSVSLFTSRAKKVRNSFALTEENAGDIVAICNRMDGMPLALELAAARIRLLTPADLLQRLNHSLDVLTRGSRDLPERHQTLRATIDWSYSLLEPPEKELLKKLSVFSGGFTIDSVEKVCGGIQVFDDLESLEEKGLVQKVEEAEMRFRLLQTIREFALEKAAEAEILEGLKKIHAQHFLEIAHFINLGTQGEDQLVRMRRGILEEPNMYEALDWFEQEARKGDKEACEMGLRMCGELFGYWHYRGKNVLAKERSLAFLNMPSCPELSQGKVNAMFTVFLCQWVMGHFENAMEMSQNGLKMAQILDLPYETAFAYLAIGLTNFATGNMEDAKKNLDISLEKAREHGHSYQMALTLMMCGMQRSVSGDLKMARDLMIESYDLFEELQEHQGIGGSSAGLALINRFEGNYGKALELYTKAQIHYELNGDKAEEARVFEETAWTWLKQEDSAKAREFFLKSLRTFKEVSSLRGVGVALLGLSACEVVNGDYNKAAVITGAAEEYSKKEGILNPYSDNYAGKEYMDELRNSLPDDEWKKTEEEGAKLSVDEVLELIDSP